MNEEKIELKFIDHGVNWYWADDNISRAYTDGSKKRFVQWFNSQSKELHGVPEVALCDEIFIANNPDYKEKQYIIDLLEVGESCIVENDICIIMRVK
jgi:hypothetical protein